MSRDIDKLFAEIEALKLENARMQALLDEWGIGSEPPIKLQAVGLHQTYCTAPGDEFRLTITDERGEKTILTEPIRQAMRIDRAAVYSFKDALGFNHAMMGVFGEAKISTKE